MSKHTFVDAVAMSRKHPTTFQVPSPQELAAIKVGCSVKVSDGAERFWCSVVRILADGKLLVAVDNELLWSDLRYGEQIIIERRFIHDVITGKAA
jgi:hypothetical protein